TRDEFDIRAAEVLAAPGAVFVGDGRAGLSIFDAARRRNPVEAASAPSHDQVEALERSGDTLFACHDNAGLFVYDVADLAAPVEIGHLELDPSGTECQSLRLSGNLLYIGGAKVLGTADVSDPAHPVLLGQTTTPDHADFASLALAGNGSALLAVTVLI